MAVKLSNKATQVPQSTGNAQKDRSLSRLLEMGFDYKSSVEALESNDYDLTKASAMLAQQSVDLSRTPTKDTVEFMEDSGVGSEPPAKRKDRGYAPSFDGNASVEPALLVNGKCVCVGIVQFPSPVSNA